MDRKIFRRLFEERIVMLDGATGSNLMQAGMPVGVCPEKYASIVRAKITANADGLTNSRSTCLHTPHGAVYPACASASSSSFPPTIAIAENSLQPSLTALKMAVRSAQFPGVNAAFSILHPVYILASAPSSAAPTAKCEYGAYENFRASAAIRIRFCIFFFSNFIYCLILYFVNYDSRYATPTLLSAGNQQPPSRHPLLCRSS